MTTPFEQESEVRVAGWHDDGEMQGHAFDFLKASAKLQYPYNFFWLGRPIIQYPQDIVATQELIWRVKPDLIIETGIAHGGSLILSASILAMIDHAEAAKNGEMLNPAQPKRRVLGVDIDIRPHNRSAIEEHPLSPYIEMIQGSSIENTVVNQVQDRAKIFSNVMVFLDSNHTHDHVLAELNAYAPLVSPGSYCIVYDTLIEDMGENFYPNRTWGPGNSPKSAVHAYLAQNPQFEIDKHVDKKLMITVASDGFLRRKN
jgi:cephalosporin hydroxylase